MSSAKHDFDSALENILQRAIMDDSFRRLCLTEPGAAFEAVTGEAPPAGLKLRFIENQGDEVTIVLPNAMRTAGELADDALTQVAAAAGWLTDWYYGCDRTCRASAGSAVVAACGPDNPH